MTMKKFKLKYGDVSTFTSATPSGVVDYLRNNSRYPMSGEDVFLRSAAESANNWCGSNIRFDSKENFAQDLMNAGMLEEVVK
tara:strand:+ start:691 stop:936 length:246 start_codon:yes stop_codon:yes gene_type:complete